MVRIWYSLLYIPCLSPGNKNHLCLAITYVAPLGGWQVRSIITFDWLFLKKWFHP